MDQRSSGGPNSRRSLLTKRAVLVVIVVVAVLLGLGLGTLSPSQSGPTEYTATDGPNGATADISASDGESVSVAFDDTAPGSPGDTSLESLNVTFDSGGEFALTGVTRDATAPAAEPPTNDTVSYLNVSHEGDAELDSVTFTFTVRKSVVGGSGASPGGVTLHRFHDGSWQVLETSLRSEDADTYTFAAVAPGLSVFAVSLSSATPVDGTPTTTVTETATATPTPTETDAVTATTTQANTTPTATSTNTTPTPTQTASARATAEPDPPGESQPDPPTASQPTPSTTPRSATPGTPTPGAPNASLTLVSATADPIATDRGDVDAVTGTLSGALSVNDSDATRAILRVTVDSPAGDERTVRRVVLPLGNRTAYRLADALGDDSLLFAAGARANEYAVETDGSRRAYDQTVTVSVTVYERHGSVANLTESAALVVTVENLEGDGSVDGESNPAAT